ncbi:MAG: hypothetical protein KC466_11990, partial [Myxococcales bacterium]|nr:hypothetical protein [Myxococcales bacterium]
MPEKANAQQETLDELTGAQKAAVLLLLVGEDAAGAVFRKLSQVEVREITSHMASLRSIRNEVVDHVAREFVAEAKRNSAITTEGRDYLHRVFREAFGEAEGPQILKQVTSLSSSNAIETLKTLDAFTISTFIRQEHPQTIAFLLCNLPPATAGEIIKTLRADFQTDVIRRMARIKLMVP